MEVELLMRRESKKTMTSEDRENYNIDRLLPGFDEDEWQERHNIGGKEYDYVPVTINLDDASPYSQHDDDHTHIFLKGGLAFIAKVKYDLFQAMKAGITGKTILSYNEVTEEFEAPVKIRNEEKYITKKDK